MQTVQQYGRYIPVYDKNRPMAFPIALDCGFSPHELLAMGCMRAQPYVTKNLLAVDAIGPAWDMPESILVKFTADEFPAVVREAFRLTVNLWETILEKCDAAEVKWKAGAIDNDTYRAMRKRLAIIGPMFERSVKVFTVAEPVTPAASAVAG